MYLRCSLTSPFGRKVQMAARHLGLIDRIDLIAADTLDPSDPLLSENPLGKMPVLVLDDGRKIFDSRVILEHLDHIAGGGLILPTEWDDRLHCLATQALADGILDAALLILYERRRPERAQHAPWIERQKGKIDRGLDALAASPPDPTRINVGTITMACLFNHLDRRGQVEWRKTHPILTFWLDRFRAASPVFDQVVGNET